MVIVHYRMGILSYTLTILIFIPGVCVLWVIVGNKKRGRETTEFCSAFHSVVAVVLNANDPFPAEMSHFHKYNTKSH